ncbi:FAD-binding protein [Paenibacillus tundrae]|uniref:Cation diffusion facilitator CzcD-associated flavoprotein CzcO n=1 Tax=Paenibacillus tundrae TaxID=528187 RepID=A0ABT9WE79_9BACL|nr:FAD-binding protein [Paenibacillus tundrae]MDQ0171334.1 cation diffusion facilitator CzcD-associated flavoprotein CzcO [Paenibacillus tundrae]
MKPIWDVIVIGGGQAGLASGYHLKKQGLSFFDFGGRRRSGRSMATVLR